LSIRLTRYRPNNIEASQFYIPCSETTLWHSGLGSCTWPKLFPLSVQLQSELAQSMSVPVIYIKIRYKLCLLVHMVHTGRCPSFVRRCGVVGRTLAFGSIGHGFESEHRLFSHHVAAALSTLRSLAKCSLDDSVSRLL